MLMKTIHTFIVLMALLLVSACYEDKGNYDYLPLHRVEVKVNLNYGIKRPETPIDYTITPEVSFNDGSTDFSNIQFIWRGNTKSDQSIGDTLSTEQSVTLHIDPAAEDYTGYYYLRLYVTDLQSGVTDMYPVNLTIIKPYTQSWFVLHDTDEHAEIGAVEYAAGEMIVTPDALSQEREGVGEPLKGKAVSMGYRQQYVYYPTYWGGLDVNTQVYVTTTDPEESGLINQGEHFLLLANWQKMIYPVDWPNFANDNSVKVSNSYQGACICSNGHLFIASMYGFLIYESKPNSEVSAGGDYYIENVFGTPTTTLCYDSKQGRFLVADTQNSYWMGSGTHDPASADIGDIMTVPSSPNNVADPSNVSADKKLVDFVGGYWYSKTAIAAWQRFAINAYMLSEETGKSYVYVFNNYPLTSVSDSEDNVPVTNFYTINTPEGVTVDTPMTSSYDFNNVLFYAVDNKIYKLDFAMTNGSSTLVYQDPDPQAKITCLQMATEEFTEELMSDATYGLEEYGIPYSRVLGAGINMPDGSGKLLVLHLNSSGKVDKDSTYPAIQEHTGFGTIKSIAFIK